MNNNRLLRYAFVGSALAVVTMTAIAITPDWVKTPDRETKSVNYYEIARIFDKKETEVGEGGRTFHQTYSGTCHDLIPDAAEAMKDGILTIGEVHALNVKGKALAERNYAVEAKNTALEAAGLPRLPNPVDCRDGDNLFNE